MQLRFSDMTTDHLADRSPECSLSVDYAHLAAPMVAEGAEAALTRVAAADAPDLNFPNGSSARSRIVDRFDPRLVNAITAVGFGLPILGYFWLLCRNSVNVFQGDQFSDVSVIKASDSHLFPWGVLWDQHNEHRMLFPRLVVILLAHTTNFNIQVEEYLSALMLLAAASLLVFSHRRRSPSTPWLYYCPVALLMFSLVQYGDTLFGFQMAWYLVLLALAVAIFLLDRISLTWLAMIGAIDAATVGSYSSFQGL
jgi:hypothetical protein